MVILELPSYSIADLHKMMHQMTIVTVLGPVLITHFLTFVNLD